MPSMESSSQQFPRKRRLARGRRRLLLITAATAAAALALVSVSLSAPAQDPKGGCKSLRPNSGDLTSPAFSLAGVSSAAITFQSWWEIEGVNPASHDLMQVRYSVDGGATWTTAGLLNPTQEPSSTGRFDQDLTDNGVNTPATWRAYAYDLSGAAGHASVLVRFSFDTVDSFYNGFRGWLIDDVGVIAGAHSVLQQSFETAPSGWTTTGFWHQQSNPQTIKVAPSVSPRLVSYPDSGSLPSAFDGTGAAWYGETSTGTYCGADAVTDYVPPPVLGKAVNLSPTSGKIAVKSAKGGGFVGLTVPRQLPVGTVVDATRGTLQLVSAAAPGQHIGTTQTGTFSGGVFKVSQRKSGIAKGQTTLQLLSNAKGCEARAASDGLLASAARGPKILQTLHASDHHGRFRTNGRYSAATVRGTIWDTVERCDGTLTVVHQGFVIVRDFARRVNVVVRAGHSYLAKPAPPKPSCKTLGDHDCDADDPRP
jgi:hypothetical protein